jgi:hypothetical protein
VLAAVCGLVAVACDGSSDSARDSVATATPPAVASAGDTPGARAASDSSPAGSSAGGTADCVSEGTWQRCSIEKRLTDAGFVPVAKGPPTAPLFPVDGTEYALGPAELHVYVFPSADARARAVAGIDTVAITRPGTPAAWGAPAWLITSNNLVAVLVSDNGRLVERVQLALTAGLPAGAR